MPGLQIREFPVRFGAPPPLLWRCTWAALIPIAASLIGGALGGKAQSKSQQSNYDRQKNFIYQALGQLSPDNISALTQSFLPQIHAAQFGVGQTAMHQLARSQSISGRFQSPGAATQRLGLSAYLGNSAQQQAFQQAMGLAGQRASVWAQQPFATTPNYNMAQGFQNAVSSGLLGYSLSQKPQSNPMTSFGGGPTTGGGYGLPTQYNPQSPLLY